MLIIDNAASSEVQGNPPYLIYLSWSPLETGLWNPGVLFFYFFIFFFIY